MLFAAHVLCFTRSAVGARAGYAASRAAVNSLRCSEPVERFGAFDVAIPSNARSAGKRYADRNINGHSCPSVARWVQRICESMNAIDPFVVAQRLVALALVLALPELE